MMTCNPLPFEDPKPDLAELLTIAAARIHGEEALLKLEATEYEKKPTHLRRFLIKGQYDVESSLTLWKDWVEWRHGMCTSLLNDKYSELNVLCAQLRRAGCGPNSGRRSRI